MLGEGRKGGGHQGRKGVIRGMQMWGLKCWVLPVACRCWGAGRAGKIMLREAKWLSCTPLPFSMVRNIVCTLSDAKGQHVALADAQKIPNP